MRSTSQIEASRRNGAKSRGPVTPEGKAKSAANSALSTGPVTPEGKARVSRNALRHGLASAIVLPDECRETFEENLAGLCEEFQPRTWTEKRFVEIMVADDWRRGRCWYMESVHLSRAPMPRKAPKTRRCELPSASALSPTNPMSFRLCSVTKFATAATSCAIISCSTAAVAEQSEPDTPPDTLYRRRSRRRWV